MTPETRSPAAPAFRHTALIIDSDQTVRQVLVPAVRQALAEADGVLVAVGESTARLLRAELGAVAGQLEWGDTSAFYQRLGFAYEGFRRFLAAARAAGRRIHVFAEPEVTSDDGTVDRTAAYLAYESICNETYAEYGCEVTCLWDARRHSTLMIENVRSLHSYELGTDGWWPSLGFVRPDQYLAGRNHLPLPLPDRVGWDMIPAGPDELPRLQTELRAWARRHGFAGSAVSDVLTAVGEVAANGLVHGQPPVRLSGWRHHDTLVVQADDHGGTPLPPTAGYRPPGPGPDSTRGLWLARQLADVMQTYTADGITSVRLYFPYRLTHLNPPQASDRGQRAPSR